MRMLKLFSRMLIIASVLILSSTASHGQGIPWYAIPLPIPGGFVDASSGNLHLEIPLGSMPQRNQDPIVSEMVYDSAFYYYAAGLWNANGLAWRGIVGTSRSGISGLVPSNQSCASFGLTNYPYGSVTTYTGFWFRDIHGTTSSLSNNYFTRQVSCHDSSGHSFGTSLDIPSTTGTSPEGVGYTFAVSNYSSWRVYASDGSLVFSNFSDQNVVPLDPNGNTGLSSAPNLTAGLPAFATFQGNTQGRACDGVAPPGSTTTSTVTTSDGSSASYTLTCTVQSVSDGTNVGSIGFLTGLGLPDGTSYSFVYDIGSAGIHDGRLLTMTLPTGGTVSFTYVSVQANPSLRVQTAAFGGGTWTFAYTPGSPTSTQLTSTVTGPPRYDTISASNLSDKTVFITNFSGGLPYVQTAQYYSGPTTLLKTVDYVYDSFSLPVTVTTTFNDTGQSYSTFYQYYGNSYRNYPTQKQETDFSGTIIRTTKTTYNTFLKPTSIKVYASDGSGSPIASTLYTYDEYSANYCKNGVTMLASFTGAYGHDDANFGTGAINRGNVTTTQRLISGTNYATTHTCYDTLGNVTQTVDANGNPTSYDYSENWADTYCIPSGTITHAFPTIITDALGHRTKKSYFSCAVLPQSTKDENDIQTNRSGTTFTYEALNRPLTINYPDGGQTTHCYSHNSALPCYTSTLPPFATESRLISGTTTPNTKTLLDSYSRVAGNQLTSDPQGTVYTDTTYDGLGKVSTVSNPYRTGSDPTTSLGTTSYGYDALGRKITETYPDSSVLQTAYCGPSTLVTDPTGKWRRSRTDGLGRLVEVDEPNAPGASVASTGCPGSGEPIWVTSYTYDTLGNLTQVIQNGSHQRNFTYDSLSRLLTSSNPEVGTITYKYDSDTSCTAPNSFAGLLVSKTDARGIRTCSQYDALNRETVRNYSNGDPTVTTTYDQANCLGLATCQNIGHRTSVTDAAGSEAWSYQIDAANLRSIHIDQRTTNSSPGNVTKTSTYYLDLAGNVTQAIYPSGRVVNYTYDAANRPSTATDGSNGITYATDFQTAPTGCLSGKVCYTPQGTFYALSIGQSTSFTGLNLTHSYNSRLQPNQFKASSTGGNAIDITYGFVDPSTTKNAGHVYSITNNLDSTRSQQFTYDQLNRITSAQTTSTYASSPAHCWGESFNVDPWGNLQSIAATTDTAYTSCSQESGFSKSADGNNHLSSLSYDLSGNTTNDGVNSYVWDGESQLKSAGGVNYTYDGDGRRVSKVGSKLYWYGSGGDILAETDVSGNTTAEYIFFGGKRIAMLPSGSNPIYYVEDLLGTSRVLTTNSGIVCYDADFYPYGGERPYTNTCPQNYKFEGKERDTETGNDDFGARYYSNRFGRWLSADWSTIPAPVPYANLTNPQTLNLYAMVSDDPESFADLDGHDVDFWDVVNFVVGAANAWASDNLLGAGRQQQDTTAGKLGAATGDIVATIQGGERAVAGGTGVVAGVSLSSTGEGAIVGVPLVAVSAPVAVQGFVTATEGAAHLGIAAADAINSAIHSPVESKATGPVKAADAPGVTAGGQATDEHGNKLGPSGDTQVNRTRSNTREGANNRARDQGSRTVEHRNPKQGKPHFHPADKNGKKKPSSTHHEYPD